VVGSTNGDFVEHPNEVSNSAFVAHIDSTNGNMIWNRAVSLNNTNYGNAVATDSNGDIIIFGTCSGGNEFETNVFITKLNLDGRIQWSQQFGTTENDYG
jgi:outer membrane protein assembly factor BamB